jgi:hypothetical protein
MEEYMVGGEKLFIEDMEEYMAGGGAVY